MNFYTLPHTPMFHTQATPPAQPKEAPLVTTHTYEKHALNRELARALRVNGLHHYVTDRALWVRVQAVAQSRTAEHGNIAKGVRNAVLGVSAINTASTASKRVIRPVTPMHVPVVQVEAASTAHMREVRAQRKASGLTARGEQPMHQCGGQVDDTSRRNGRRDCKRRAVRGSMPEWPLAGFCSYEHARQFGLGDVFLGLETLADVLNRARKVSA